MREIIFKVYTQMPDSQRHDWLPLTGYFHGWGLESTESSDGNISWTAGICEEKNTGRIYLALPSQITFSTPYNEQKVETTKCGPLPETADGRHGNQSPF